ncbi:DUF5642 family protein [Mycolicibacterium sediminis]|uniref:DUF5642 domain-containing protein n=1 Tax=Mycolicibacterium sediminis TaxID=1286180 RepID=A0A7I7R0H8_9MYCO|nr:DUF5642 family protein [Mycolicibacterium sediminis]BBY31656.1 hypothetical protein MSEDJ_57520 [Mycolicibacterium sediminis]
MSRILLALLCAAAVTSCSGGGGADASQADIGAVRDVKSTFGPEFTVKTVDPTGIDPRLLAPQTLPAGVRFDPPGCTDLAKGLELPPGLQGNMSAVTAEGAGNRFITIAVETSESVPFPEPGPDCQKVAYAGPGARGLVEVTESPDIEGARTLGTHRVVQTMVGGKPATGELYNYVASVGRTLVIVTANPLVVPDKPVVPVDVQRARDLLVSAVNDVRAP